VIDLSDAYANAAHIPGAADYPPRWAAAAAAFRDGARWETMPYGTGAREWLDLFWPRTGAARGLLVFVHGGYWRAFGPRDWSHLAAGGVARGWAVALPGYTLAPEARISEITQQIQRAIGTAAEKVPGPLVLTGHSAGGHLVARMVCQDIDLQGVSRVIPISPLADLRPLLQTDMNRDLRLDAAEAREESVVSHGLAPGVAVSVRVGGAERPVFLEQAKLLANHWNCPLEVVPGRHHFDVIDALADPESDLVEALVAPA
jgi:arylformamidase